MKVLLVAEESAGINVLRALAGTEHEVVAALTAEPTRGGGATVGSVAEGLGVLVRPSASVREPALAAWVREEQIDLLLNVHSLYVVHADVVAAPRIGSFNVHPGPLPHYAGLNAPSWAIYYGEPRHAVTVHWMEAGVDTGPVAYATEFELGERDTGLSVSTRCAREGVALVLRLVEAAAADPASIPREPQDLSRRRWLDRSPPGGGWLVWQRSARELDALVRACDYAPFPSPWGDARAKLRDEELGILKTRPLREEARAAPGTVVAVDDAVAAVAAGEDTLVVERVRVGGAGVAAGDVLRQGDVLAGGS